MSKKTKDEKKIKDKESTIKENLEKEAFEEVLDEVTTEEVEKEDYQQKYMMALAETENLRKRMQKEKTELVKFSVENSIASFLPIIDSFESALSCTTQCSEEIKNWAKGFEMLLNQFKEILLDHNIVSFHSEGNLFNPHEHEAVEIEEKNDVPDGTILQVFYKGYKCGNRTIRPAKVKVAKSTKK